MPFFFKRSALKEGRVEYVWAPVYTSRYGKARAQRFAARHHAPGSRQAKRVRRTLERAARRANR